MENLKIDIEASGIKNIRFSEPMSQHTSFKVGGPAELFFEPADVEELKKTLGFVIEHKIPYYVIGNGTNLLVGDNGIRGAIIKVGESFGEIDIVGEEITVECGVLLSTLSKAAARNALTGLEFASGIPGYLGGAVAMNAGAYGGEMKDVVEKIEAVDIKGQTHTFDKASLKFSYRKCELPADMIITKAYLRLQKGSPDEIKKRMKECKDKRKATRAINLSNAGSIFKNPQGSSAGMLIEESGLKGVKIGGAQISEAHGNYIVNLGNASARDVLALIAIARDKIFKIKGILLETEIKVIGED